SYGIHMPTVTGVPPGYFRATGLRLLRGTGLSGSDVDGTPAEIVVNEAAAKLMWPDREALGQCVRLNTRASECYTVTGVVETASRNRLIENEPGPQLYIPLGHPTSQRMSGTVLVVRSPEHGLAAATAEVTAALRR